MKKIELPSSALKLILDEFIKKKEIHPKDARGLRQWGEGLGDNGYKLPNKEIIKKGKLLSNWYYDISKEGAPSKISVFEETLCGITMELGYISTVDFLKINGFIDEKSKYIEPKDLNTLRTQNPPYPNEWIDKYILGARFVPSLVALSSLPTLFIILALKGNGTPDPILWVLLLTYFSIAYAASGWLSMRGKEFEKKYFFSQDHNGFPTSYLMLYSHDSKYSENQKLEYREKVKGYFQLDLKAKKEESQNEAVALQLLHEVGTKVKDNVKSNIIRSSNIRYGLIRNLVPATLLGGILSVLSLGVVFFLNDQLTLITLSVLAIILFIAHLQLRYGKTLRQAAEAYATYLLDEFLSR